MSSNAFYIVCLLIIFAFVYINRKKLFRQKTMQVEVPDVPTSNEDNVVPMSQRLRRDEDYREFMNLPKDEPIERVEAVTEELKTEEKKIVESLADLPTSEPETVAVVKSGGRFAKFDDDEIRAIRQAARDGSSAKQIAEERKVTERTIQRIISRDTYPTVF